MLSARHALVKMPVQFEGGRWRHEGRAKTLSAAASSSCAYVSCIRREVMPGLGLMLMN